jgi:Niemann-Pick C1 protein
MKLTLVLLIALVSYTFADCTITNSGYYDEKSKNRPTSPNKMPIQLPLESAKSLAALCDQYPVGTKTCCNVTQVNEMVSNFDKIEVVFWHCPSCLVSYKRMWCDFACSSQQSEFVHIMEMLPPPLERFVGKVAFEISPEYEAGIWASCKNNKIGVVDLECVILVRD